MTSEDQGQLERLIDRGITPRMHINVQNTFTNGPVETANVVGEIRGTEHPSKFSWSAGISIRGIFRKGQRTTVQARQQRLALRTPFCARDCDPPHASLCTFHRRRAGLDVRSPTSSSTKSEMQNHLGDLILDEGQGIVKGSCSAVATT